MICSRCNRKLTRTPVYIAGHALGPRCAAVVAGRKPKPRIVNRTQAKLDDRQPDLFQQEARA